MNRLDEIQLGIVGRDLEKRQIVQRDLFAVLTLDRQRRPQAGGTGPPGQRASPRVVGDLRSLPRSGHEEALPQNLPHVILEVAGVVQA